MHINAKKEDVFNKETQKFTTKTASPIKNKTVLKTLDKVENQETYESETYNLPSSFLLPNPRHLYYNSFFRLSDKHHSEKNDYQLLSPRTTPHYFHPATSPVNRYSKLYIFLSFNYTY